MKKKNYFYFPIFMWFKPRAENGFRWSLVIRVGSCSKHINTVLLFLSFLTCFFVFDKATVSSQLGEQTDFCFQCLCSSHSLSFFTNFLSFNLRVEKMFEGKLRAESEDAAALQHRSLFFSLLQWTGLILLKGMDEWQEAQLGALSPGHWCVLMGPLETISLGQKLIRMRSLF